MSESQKPRGDQDFVADKVEPIAPHRAAKRSDNAELLDALSGAMRAPQMMHQDDVLLGGLGSDDGARTATAEHPEEAATEADPRQLDLLAKSA
ncbi:hypothetical protein CKO28_04095 [Rhodovibrio sodomensis]|uniref:Uncharacterized protein n=1 Tax=Rhodovibrio sodomensis TaxID=1088 RepID=A0ABS1DBX7_9PROT|nr:hypothetical protein [Rhodovibrio sodomensis]MBK1667223.1 hypothetical protein [Rhodovibrio sodomensis]